LSLILLFTFVVFGSFLFAMTTYAAAFVDYILHFVSLSFGAYGPQSSDAFAMALPETAKPLAQELFGGATNAWGSYDGFKAGLTGAAAALDEATLSAVYAAGEQGGVNLAGKLAGPPSIGRGGLPSRLLWVCSWRGFRAVVRCVSLSWAAYLRRRWCVLPG
jgi:hypothetical protein